MMKYLYINSPGVELGVVNSTGKGNDVLIGSSGSFGYPLYGGFREIEFYAYYPQGMKNPKLVIKGDHANDFTYTVDESNSRIIGKLKPRSSDYDLTTSVIFNVEYDIPENLQPGTYSNKEKDFAKIKYYDETPDEYLLSGDLYTVEVVDNYSRVLSISDLHSLKYSDKQGDAVISNLLVLNLKNPYTIDLEDQVIEMKFSDKMEVYTIQIPYDSKKSDSDYTMYYKTNMDSNWRKTKERNVKSSIMTQINSDMLNFKKGEYFTEVRIELGDFSKEHVAYKPGSRLSPDNPGVFGKIKYGYTSADVEIEVYNKNYPTESTGIQIVSSTVASDELRRSASNSKVFISDGENNITLVEPGDPFYLEGQVQLHGYPYGSDILIHKPTLYFRQLDDTTIDIEKAKFFQEKGENVEELVYGVDWTYSYAENTYGEKLYHVNFISDVYIGGYIDSGLELMKLSVKVPYQTSRKMKGAFNVRDIFGYGSDLINAMDRYGGAAVDIFDLNNNGDTTELIFSTNSIQMTVNDLNSVLVDTFISVEGQGNLVPHDPENPDTIVPFNPQMKLDYDVVLSNYTTDPVDEVIMYIPIPKTGQDFGQDFQENPFTWNMKLEDVIQLPDELKDKLEVGYGVNVNKNNYETAEYFGSVQFMNQVNMLRIKNKTCVKMPVEAIYNLRIPMMVDETYNSATQGDKIGKLNVYKPKTWVDSATYTGPVPGIYVGAQLVITEIGGKVFYDINKTGINEDTSFTNVPGHTVSLYKKDKDTGEYAPALKPGTSEHITTQTDGDGKYKFEYEDGLREGIYGVKFEPIDGYSFTMHSDFDRNLTSSAIYKKDYPNEGDDYVGWILDITSTAINSDKMNAGFIQYTKDDLGISILDKTRRIADNGSIVIPKEELTISPDFFDVIKAETDTFTWSATANGSQVTLVPDTDGKGGVTINAKPLTSGSIDVKVKVTIKDMYGNTKDSNEVIITIYSTTPPTVTGTDLWASVGESKDLYEGVSAVDNAGNNITLTNSNKAISHSIPMSNDNKFTTAGTYEAEYTIKDSNGIEGVGRRLVKVVGLVDITAAPQVYSITDSNIKGLVETAGSATYLAAPASVGVGVETNTTTSMRIVDGPSVSFDKPGLYTVEYKAQNSLNKEGSKQVKVLIKSESAISEDSLVLEATGFTLENAEAYLLTDVLAKDDNHAKVRAYKVKEENGVITSISEITNKVTVNNTELQAIRSVNKMGDIFDLTFEVTDEDTAQKTVKVAVKGTHTEVIDDYAITAKDYIVGLNEVPSTKEDKIDQVKDADYGNVNIVSIVDESKNPVTLEIDVDAYTKSAGKHKVTFNAENLPNIKGELFVTVKDEAMEGTDYKIGLDTIVISVEEAKSILAMGNGDRRDYFTNAMNPIVERVDGNAHTASAVYDKTNIQAVEGKYSATFYVSAEPQTSIDGTVIVLDKDVVVTEGEYVIAANNFMIGVDNLPTTYQNMVDRAEAVVYSKYDLNNNIFNNDLGAKTETDLTKEIKKQPVRFTAKTITGHPNLVADVTADVVKDSVTNGDTYVLRSKDTIRIQKHEAVTYKDPTLGTLNPIIGVADAEAFMKGNLSKKGTVNIVSIDFDEIDGGTVTLGVVEDPEIEKIVNVQIRGLNDPDLTVTPKTMYLDLNEVFDYKLGVTATDNDNGANIINWDNGNLTIESLYGAPDATTLDTSEQGVYTYKYSATDLNGVTVSEIRIVVVQDPEYPIDVVGDYYIVSKNIMKKPSDFTDDDDQNKQLILDYSEPYAVHKNTGKKENVIVSNLNGFTNAVGEYSVDVKVDVTGANGTGSIKVVLTDGGIDENGKYYITAQNATVGKERARELIADDTNAELFDEMSVVPTILVSGKPLSETPAQTHPITYTVSQDTGSHITRSLTIKKDEIVDVEDGYVIGANPFVVGRENIEAMNNDNTFADYIKLSGANAHKEDAPLVTYNVKPITQLDEDGPKDQTITYAIIDPNDNTQVLAKPTVTVKVKVEDDKSETKGKYTLVGEHFTITGAQALTLVGTEADDDTNDHILLDGGNLRSYLSMDHEFTEEGNPIVFDRSSIKVEEGPHNVTFSLEEEPSIKLVLKVRVDLKDGPSLDVNNYSVIDVDETFNPIPELNGGYDHNDNDRPLVYSDLDVDTDNVKEGVVGMYEVYYSYTDVAGYTTTKTHVVVIDDGSIKHDGDYIIYGENVVLKTEEVVGDIDALVKSKSNAKAYLKSNTDGDIELVDPLDITMDASEVKPVVDVYDASIGIKDKTDKKGIKVYVTDGEIHKNDEYTIVTNDISIGQKDAEKDKVELDPIIIKKSGTYAVHKTKPVLGTIAASHNIKKDVKTYDVTYSVVESTESADAKVHVLADEVVENKGFIYVAANSFVIGADNVDALTDQDYVTYANAHAWEEKFNSGTKEAVFTGPRADKTIIDTPQDTSYGVKLDNDILDDPRADVKVKVLKGKTDRGDGYTLNGQNFTITGPQALLLKNTDKEDKTNDHILLTGGKLRSFLNNSFDESGTPYVIDRSAINVTKGTYQVTFGIEEDPKVELVLDVLVDTKKKAELLVDNYSVLNLNDTFKPQDYFHGGTDFNDNNRAIVYGDVVVDATNVNSKVVGLYEVTYTYTDAVGYVTTELHVVAVTDGSIEVDGDYLIYGENVVLKTEEVTGDVDALVKSKSNAKAYLKSNTNGKIELVNPSEITMDASEVKPIVGDYDATIGISGKADTKGIKVYVTDGEIHKNDEYTIVTSDISISQTDAAKAKAELDPIIIEKSGTYAVHKTKPQLGTIAASHNIKKDVKTYDVTYSVVESNETADAKVHVLADEVVENEGFIYIKASSFVIGSENVDAMNDQTYIDYAKAHAWEEKFDSGTKEAVFLGPDLDKTNVSTPQGLEYGVELDGTLIDKPRANVEGLVLDGKTDRGDKYTLYGKHFEISGADAYKLMNTKADDESNDSILLLGGSLTSYLNNSFDPSGTPVVLDRSAIKNEDGKYKVLFGVKEDSSVTLELEVTVKMPRATDLIVNPLKEIKVEDTFNPEAEFVSGYDYGIDYAIKYSDLDVDTSKVDTSKKGIYEVPYTYVDSSGRTNTRILVLVVNDGSIVIVDDEYIINADNFMIKDVDVEVSDEAVIKKSKAEAYKVSDHEWVDVKVSDFGGYSSTKGRYTITLQVVEEPTATKSILAEVVYGEIDPGLDYLISATDITLGYKDAQVITEDEIITRANAVAIHKTLNKAGTVVIRETNYTATPGEYYVIFEVKEDPSTFIRTKITVLEDEHVIEDRDYIIAASSFAVGDEFIKEMNKEDLVRLANARAWAKDKPSVMLDVTQTEDIITSVGQHKVTFHIVSKPEISVKVDKTIFKDVMYELEAFDAEIDIDDLTKAINTDRLDQTILEITNSRGYRVHADGSKTNMQVYVADNSSLLNAVSGQRAEVILTLVDSNARDNRSLTVDHRVEEVNTPVFINVTSKDKDKDKEKDKDRKGVNTGIEDDTLRLLTVLGLSTMIVLVILVNEKKKRRTE